MSSLNTFSLQLFPVGTTLNTASINMSNSNFQLSNVFDVKGKVALVTGGGSGIGLMVIVAADLR